MSYLMTYENFIRLSSMEGFNTFNGRTYAEHICIVFKDKLTEELKKQIMNTKSPNEIEGILISNNISFIRLS